MCAESDYRPPFEAFFSLPGFPCIKIGFLCVCESVSGAGNRFFYGQQKGRDFMLQIKKLTITHKKDLRVILRDFSCALNAGDKAVIIGEEGDGKSTLLKWIYSPDLLENYAEAAGERIVNHERLAYLPQELPETDKGKTVYEFFAEEAGFFEKTPRDLSLFTSSLQIPPDFFYSDQKMGTLSGGEKIRAQMLRLLMSEPTVLLLDEPSNDIDIQTLDWLEGIIQNWDGIVLFISHDEILIERAANMVIHLEQIKRKTESRCTVAHVPYLQYKKERANLFEKQEQQALNDRREKKIRDEKLRRMESSVSFKLDNIPKAQRDGKGRLLKKKMKAVKSLKRRFEREDAEMTQMPEEEEAIFFKLGEKECAIPAGKTVVDYSLDKLYAPAQPSSPPELHGQNLAQPASEQCTEPQRRLLSENIHLQIRGSEKICIIGKNGVGKTTLLRKIAGELLARKDIHAEYMPQNYEEELDLSATPVDFLDTSGDKEERTRIRTFLGSLKYTADEMAHPVAELSGGQKAKVLLLKMSLSGANVLILDEPTRNFSPLSGGVIRKMLAEFPGAIISISHDRKYIEEVCDKVYTLTPEGLFLTEQ